MPLATGLMARLSWPEWLVIYWDFRNRELNRGPATHPSTNRARRRVTSLIETNVLPLSQTANYLWKSCAILVRRPVIILYNVFYFWIKRQHSCTILCKSVVLFYYIANGRVTLHWFRLLSERNSSIMKTTRTTHRFHCFDAAFTQLIRLRRLTSN